MFPIHRTAFETCASMGPWAHALVLTGWLHSTWQTSLPWPDTISIFNLVYKSEWDNFKCKAEKDEALSVHAYAEITHQRVICFWSSIDVWTCVLLDHSGHVLRSGPTKQHKMWVDTNHSPTLNHSNFYRCLHRCLKTRMRLLVIVKHSSLATTAGLNRAA